MGQPGCTADDCSAAARPFANWVADYVKDRDPSHGMAHFMRVRGIALDLAKGMVRPSCLLHTDLHLELVALAHDVRDHKYVTPGASMDEAYTAMLANMMLCGLSEEEARAVILAAENISWSLEKAGLRQDEELARSGARWARDVVSDADKIDALGVTGLERTVQFEMEAFAKCDSEAAWNERLRARSAAVNEGRAGYLVSEAAKARANDLLEEMHAVLESNTELKALRSRSMRGRYGVEKGSTLDPDGGVGRAGCCTLL